MPAPPLPSPDEAPAWMTGLLGLAQHFGRFGIFERDLRTGEGRWSSQMYTLYGFDPADGVPPISRILERLHPDDRDAASSVLGSALGQAGHYETRFRLLAERGEVRHMLERWEVRNGDDGQPAVSVGILIDDSEAIAAQRAAVRERERAIGLSHRLALITEAAGVGLWTVDVATGALEWTEPMFRLYGVAPGHQPATLDELVQRFVPAEHHAAFRANRARAGHTGRDALQFSFPIVRADGQRRVLSTWSRREMSADGRLVAYGVTMDITAQRDIEQRLRERDESALLAAESAGIGAWETEVATWATLWNPQMYRLRGLDPDCGLAPSEVRDRTLHPEDMGPTRSLVDRALATGERFETEFRVTWPDGQLRWLAVRGVARRDADGRVSHLVGVNWDVTDRRLADEARRAQAAAEQANRAKSSFLSRMSHELRTPLNAVLGFTQLMQQDAEHETPTLRADRLRRVDAAGRHLLALIDDVLDISAIETESVRLDLRPLPLQAAFDEGRHWLGEQAARQSIHVHVAPTAAWVMADERRLRQVIANLLSNAVKYNRPGGSVWVDAVADDPAAPRHWTLRVRDNGRGLSQEQRAHLFEPFNRLGAETGDIPGHGMGLVIVQRIVQRMGGEVALDASPGQGSEFRVTLPAASPGTPPAALPPTPLATARPADAAAGSRPLHLVYIEDNPVNLLLVEQLVRRRPGTTMVSAGYGHSGVALAIAQRPDLVLVDMQLPDIDGFEVLSRLREAPGLAGCRFVALSASAMPDFVQRALAHGFHDYWTKPIGLDAFHAALDRVAAQLPTLQP